MIAEQNFEKLEEYQRASGEGSSRKNPEKFEALTNELYDSIMKSIPEPKPLCIKAQNEFLECMHKSGFLQLPCLDQKVSYAYCMRDEEGYKKFLAKSTKEQRKEGNYNFVRNREESNSKI